ncbi:cytosolic 5'-nucleotidase 1A-like isoform X2 [Triplophysa dalaica]|nr:cytosolic 5'-nucleotidase 1A-like isoform X2 [Triplophysa dalaica]XP_056616264.1 cytosolic 5'-nucleotidase 1A-like isoform X2 [Triplophysa dalaica]
MTSFTIAVTSCALFNQERTDIKGVAFPFVKAINMVNQHMDQEEVNEGRFKIVLITKSCQENVYGLKIDHIRQITAKKTLLEYLNDLKPVLYLSTDSDSVREAIKAGYGAAIMFQTDYTELSDDKLRVAFDGDGVLFSDESERVYKERGLDAFLQNEEDLEDKVLRVGPLGEFAKALLFIQKRFTNICPVRTYLVTSRNAGSPAIRGFKTLQEHGLGIDEAFFLGGAHKGPILKAIKPHIFFDDQQSHVDGALEHGVVGAYVPFGVCSN